MNKKNIFVTGISTEVGKTVNSAIITQSLGADYWKPIQSGDLHNSDRLKVQSWVSNQHTIFHKEAYALNYPLSPHASAKMDGLTVDLKKIQRPLTENHLVIEGAGGLLVPLNDSDFIIDLIKPEDCIICISRHYLGSINHTLLSLRFLSEKFPNNPLALLFSGDKNPETERIILKQKLAFPLGRTPELKSIDPKIVAEQADQLRDKLTDFLQRNKS